MRSQSLFFALILALCCSIAAQAQPLYYNGDVNGSSSIPGTLKRSPLNSLERATAQGRTILSDGFGNQRWTDYVYIQPTAIGFTPTPTGNTTNLSSFVTTPAADVYYIDWAGRAVRLYSAAAGGDKDWLNISDNQIPQAVTNAIYNRNYAAVGARYLWPGTGVHFLVADSTNESVAVNAGNRGARYTLYNYTAGQGASYGLAGSGLQILGLNGTNNLSIGTAAGTNPAAPSAPFVNHFEVNFGEQYVRMNFYPRTRVDTNTALNYLYTDELGIVRSKSSASLVPGAAGSYVDDAAAAAGGVAIGQLYYLSVGNPYGQPAGTPKKRTAWLWLLLAAPAGRLRAPGRLARRALLATCFLLLLVLRSKAQIVGGAGVCAVKGDPNTIPTLRYQAPANECLIAVDTTTGLRYRYVGTQVPGFRWVCDTSQVVTEYPLIGNGTDLDAVRIDNGSAVNDVLKWNGAAWVIGAVPGGGGQTLVYDNYRLPATWIKTPATGLAANESVTNYLPQSVNPTRYKYSTTPLGTSSTEYGGWLANGTSGDSIALTAPCWVVIGDSQAEGHPGLHGRLHPNGVATFSVNYQDTLGQLSFRLRQLTKMRWFNQGIGSQTSSQVWARWRRDVLAETFNVGDGRGSKTLQRKPAGVVVIVGVNDLANGAMVSTVVLNLENMARSARDNGIQAVFLNCPGDEIGALPFYQKVDSLNNYFSSGALQALGASVVDYNSWWRDKVFNDNAHGQPLIIDDIHPSKVGYDSLAYYIFRNAKLPVLDSVTFINRLSPSGFVGYSRPSAITIQGENYTLSGDSVTIKFNTPLAWDSVWVKVVSSVNVTGIAYNGFSHILWTQKNDTAGVVTRIPQLFKNYSGSGSPFTRTGSNIYPSVSTDNVLIGTPTNTAGSQLYVKAPLSTGNPMLACDNSSGQRVLTVLDNNRVVVGSTSLGGYNFGVNGSAYFQSTSSNYTYLGGSQMETYGTPIWRIQSTAVNTGGTGYTEFRFQFNGNEILFEPPASSAGADKPVRFRNKAGDWQTCVDLPNKRLGVGTATPIFDIDCRTTGAIRVPIGNNSQEPTGERGTIRLNTQTRKYKVVRNGTTWENLFTTADTLGATIGQKLTWTGAAWTPTQDTTYQSFNSTTINWPLTSGISGPYWVCPKNLAGQRIVHAGYRAVVAGSANYDVQLQRITTGGSASNFGSATFASGDVYKTVTPGQVLAEGDVIIVNYGGVVSGPPMGLSVSLMIAP